MTPAWPSSASSGAGGSPASGGGEKTSALLARGVAAGEFPADLDVPATADVLCAMQLGVIEQMHQVNEVALAVGPAHLEAAARILVGGVTAPSDSPAPVGARP